MTDTDARPPMTVEDTALMREIVKWRRENGVAYLGILAEYRDARGWAVTWDYATGAEIGMTRARFSPMRWTPVRTVTEAVDVLVAFGFLPKRFSSAYRDGFRNGRRFQSAANNYQGGTAYAQSLLPAVMTP